MKKILVVGMDKICKKNFYIYDQFINSEFNVHIFTKDKLNYAGLNKRDQVTVAKKNQTAEIFQFISIFFRFKPDIVEVYHTNIIPQFIYVLIPSLFKTKITTVCIGELYYWKNFNRLRTVVTKYTLKMSSSVIVTELYMSDVIAQNVPSCVNKQVFIHNKVPLPKYDKIYDHSNYTVLFLNSLKVWRRPHLIIEAAALLKNKLPNLSVNIVGSTVGMNYLEINDEYTSELKDLINRNNLKDVVNILPFCDDVETYYKNSSIFVLPSDLVYCNNSLLEAMSYGLPAIVSDVDGANLIVTDRVDGYVVKQTAEAIAQAIYSYFTCENCRVAYSKNAQDKIDKIYNSSLFKNEFSEIWNSVLTN